MNAIVTDCYVILLPDGKTVDRVFTQKSEADAFIKRHPDHSIQWSQLVTWVYAIDEQHK